VRYRDPAERREIWLGAEVGGVVLPARLGLSDRTIWTVRSTGAWAVAATPWLAAGGRHSLSWYEASGVGSALRLRLHEHQLELSGRPMAAGWFPRMDDRLAIGFDTHRVDNVRVDDVDFKVGGLKDTIAHVGYGIEHLLGRRWALGWRVQGRYAWVFVDTQRQLRASVRATVWPRPPHAISLEAIGYYVNRNADQFGNDLPRNSVHGQFALDYAWLSRYGVGVGTRARFATSYLSGEAPVYEVREEALNNLYGDLTVGLRAVWR
jgi:hypothetical protein